MSRLLKLTAWLIVAGCILGVLVNTGTVSAAYEGERLIDDPIFLNSKSMSINDVQNFLDNKKSGIASMQFTVQCYGQNSKERQWYEAAGATCDTPVPASEVIYYAAQIYGINPQVILGTLQKEQNLITTQNPTDRQIGQAMGYSCPTSGNCSSSSNFSYQIDSGTWVLRYNYEKATGNNTWWDGNGWVCGSQKIGFYSPSLYPSQNVSFYDGEGGGAGVKYQTYFIENAATSSMYCYTPHAYNNFTDCTPAHGVSYVSSKPIVGDRGKCYSGSYNFVKAFEAWFGSTFGDFNLIECNDIKYIHEKGRSRKRLLTSEAISAWRFEDYSFATNSSLCNLDSFDVEATNLARSRKTQKLYLIDSGNYYHVGNQDIASSWNLGETDQVAPYFDSGTITLLLNRTGDTPVVATSDNPDVTDIYLINNGKRYPVAGTSDLNKDNLRHIRGGLGYYSRTPVFSVAALSKLSRSTSISYSLSIGGSKHVFDYGKIRKINEEQSSEWSSIPTGPALSNSVLKLFKTDASIGSSFYGDNEYFSFYSPGNLIRITSSKDLEGVLSFNIPSLGERIIDEIKVLYPFDSLDVISESENIRLIECDGVKFLVERSVRKKRILSEEALENWGLNSLFFNKIDKGCEYPSYSLELTRSIRSRNTGYVYYIDKETAYRAHSQEAADVYSIGDITTVRVPQFNPESIRLLNIVKTLPDNL
jgi:hypothetical protein